MKMQNLVVLNTQNLKVCLIRGLLNMSSLLNRYPSTTFLNYTITNLATGIKLNDLVKDEAAAFLPYVVPEIPVTVL